MNYEQKYKEALEKAKIILCNLPEGSKSIQDIETIFPELRESEDERILETIKKCLIFDCSLSREETDKCLAYLEKQKEQQPVAWKDEYREEDIQTRFAFYTYKDDPSTLYLSNVFVEEASRNHGFGTRILKAAEKAAEAVGATTISLKVKQDSPANAWYRKRGYGYVAFEGDYDWLEKNLEYLKPKQEVEWSEENEATRIKAESDSAYLEQYNPLCLNGRPDII